MDVVDKEGIQIVKGIIHLQLLQNYYTIFNSNVISLQDLVYLSVIFTDPLTLKNQDV